MDRSAFEKELEIERALRKIAMDRSLEKSDESDFYGIVKIIRKEDELDLGIYENGIDDEMERALEKIDYSVYYKIAKLIIKKDYLWKASSENELGEVVLNIILKKQKFMKENGIKKDVFDYLLKKMEGYLWYSGYV